jgi:hypothetical protein
MKNGGGLNDLVLCILRALALKLSVWVVVRYRNSLYRNSCNNIYVQANDHHAVLRCNMLLCQADHSEIRDSDLVRTYILNPQIFRCLLEVVIFVISSSKDISIPTVDGYWSYWEQETSHNMAFWRVYLYFVYHLHSYMLQLLTGSDCFVGTCLGLLGPLGNYCSDHVAPLVYRRPFWYTCHETWRMSWWWVLKILEELKDRPCCTF